MISDSHGNNYSIIDIYLTNQTGLECLKQLRRDWMKKIKNNIHKRNAEHVIYTHENKLDLFFSFLLFLFFFFFFFEIF
jgi:hypothetical protein